MKGNSTLLLTSLNTTDISLLHLVSHNSAEIFMSGNKTDICLNNESWGFIVTALTSFFIITGNLLIITVLIRFPSRRFRALNWLICQLAVADTSVGIVVFWIGTVSTLVMKSVTLMDSLITYGLLAAFTSTSVLGVFLVALDRYFYVIRHSEYKQIVTKNRFTNKSIVQKNFHMFCVYAI